MSAVLGGTGPLFLTAEIEVYQPASGVDGAPGQPAGVLAAGTLSLTSPIIADTATLRAADLGYVTRETDPGGLHVYPPILASGVEIDRALDLAPGGQGAAAGWGTLRLANDQDALTALALSRNADGRAVRLRLGRKQPLATDLVPLLLPGGVAAGGGSFARAHTPGDALLGTLAADDTSWIFVGADQPRLTGSARRRRHGAGRANALRNPRGIGAPSGGVVPNTFSTTTNLPTHWQIIGAVSPGLTLTCLGPVELGGLPGVRFALSGTPANTAGWSISFERSNAASGGPAAAPGEAWTAAVTWRLVSGSLTGIAPAVQVNARTAAGSFVGSATTGLPGTLGAIARPVAGLAATPASTGLVTATALVTPTSTTTPVDLVFDLAAPQLERGSFATDPILPAPGSIARASTAAEDSVWPLAALGLDPRADGTFYWAGVVARTTASDAVLWQLDDGTSSNRVFLRNVGGSTAIGAQRVTAGASLAGTAAGTLVTGQLLRCLLTKSGDRLAYCLNGGPVRVLTGAPTDGLAWLRLASGLAGDAPLWGETAFLGVSRSVLPDALLPTSCLQIPA